MMEIKETYINPNVGFYEVAVQDIGSFKYRILAREPKMPEKEFEVLVDQLMTGTGNDINKVVRSLVDDHNFKILGLESQLTYNP